MVQYTLISYGINTFFHHSYNNETKQRLTLPLKKEMKEMLNGIIYQ